MSIRSTTRAAVVVLLAVGLASVGLTASTAAATTSNLERALRHAPSGGGAEARNLDPATDCFDDRDGDVAIDSTGADDQMPIDEEHADIRRHCINFGPTIALTVTVDAPTDPMTDEAWLDATFVAWFVDTDGDDDGDYFAEISLTSDASAFVGTISELQDNADATVTCSNLTANATSTGYSISGIDESCFGNPARLWTSPAIFYDYDGADADDRVAFDNSPDDDNFDGPVDQDVIATPTSRYAGATRGETSIAISQAQFPNGANIVYLARDGQPDGIFADAVAGGTLTDGPILLVPSCGGVPQSILDEIARLNPTQVIALGGPVAICDANLAEASGTRARSRVQGPSRFETAVAIAERQFPNGSDTVYLARADLFADAAVGGTVTDGPILLVPSCGPIPQSVLNEIEDQTPSRVIAFGGQVAICDATFVSAITAAPGSPEFFRLAGETRIGTSVAISQHVFPDPGTTDDPVDVFLARQDLFADAIVGGVLTGGPILLSPSCGMLPGEVAGEISRLGPANVIALGGPVAICDAILTQAGAQ